MRDDSNDSVEEVDVRQTLLRRLAAIVTPAIDRLGQAIRGEQSFDDDRQLRACVAVARLAPLLVAPGAVPEPPRRLIHPDISDEEAERLLDVIEGKTTEYEGFSN